MRKKTSLPSITGKMTMERVMSCLIMLFSCLCTYCSYLTLPSDFAQNLTNIPDLDHARAGQEESGSTWGWECVWGCSKSHRAVATRHVWGLPGKPRRKELGSRPSGHKVRCRQSWKVPPASPIGGGQNSLQIPSWESPREVFFTAFFATWLFSVKLDPRLHGCMKSVQMLNVCISTP